MADDFAIFYLELSMVVFSQRKLKNAISIVASAAVLSHAPDWQYHILQDNYFSFFFLSKLATYYQDFFKPIVDFWHGLATIEEL